MPMNSDGVLCGGLKLESPCSSLRGHEGLKDERDDMPSTISGGKGNGADPGIFTPQTVTSTIYTEPESNRRRFVCLGREVWDLTQPDVFAQ
jgi:hypothetical protein